MPVTSKLIATSHSTPKGSPSTHVPVLSTTRSVDHPAVTVTGPAGGESGIQSSSSSSLAIAPTTALHPSTTSRRVVKSSTTIANHSSQTGVPLAHDKASHGVPTAAIVAAAAVSSIVILGIIYKLWSMRRSRRRGGQYGTTPLPPPRSSVFAQSTYSGAGSRHPTNNTTTNSNSTIVQETRPSASDEAYSNNESGPLKPSTPTSPTPMRDQRPMSWISFDGKSTPRPLIPPPPNALLDLTPVPRSPANPFASSEDDVHERRSPRIVGSPLEAYVPEIHGDTANENYRLAQETSPASPLEDDNDDADGRSVVTSDLKAIPPLSLVDDDAPRPLPSYPSLPTAASSVTYMSSTASINNELDYPLRPPSRQPRSPPPQAVPISVISSSPISQQQPTYPNINSASPPHHPSYLRNSIYQPSPPIPPPSSDPYPSSASPPLDRRVSYASSVHTHRSGGARPSRQHGNNHPSSGSGNIGPGGIPRGAPHLPHVRAAVDIILPTPLAAQMNGSGVPIYAAAPTPSNGHSHAYRHSLYEVGGGPRTDVAKRRSRVGSQLRRSTSRTSVNSDAWADVTLSARHRQPPLPPVNANANGNGSGGVDRVRAPSQNISPSLRPNSQPPPPILPPLSLPPNSASPPPSPSPLLPPTRPWDDRNRGRTK